MIKYFSRDALNFAFHGYKLLKELAPTLEILSLSEIEDLYYFDLKDIAVLSAYQTLSDTNVWIQYPPYDAKVEELQAREFKITFQFEGPINCSPLTDLTIIIHVIL